jgi:hypothetical protein
MSDEIAPAEEQTLSSEEIARAAEEAAAAALLAAEQVELQRREAKQKLINDLYAAAQAGHPERQKSASENALTLLNSKVTALGDNPTKSQLVALAQEIKEATPPPVPVDSPRMRMWRQLVALKMNLDAKRAQIAAYDAEHPEEAAQAAEAGQVETEQ